MAGVTTEQPLAGGMDRSGSVVRVGDTVRRPVRPWSAAVEALLLHLESVGFDAAPRFLGRDDRGRQVLSYVDGEVPLPPYPAWSMTDRALHDLGRLVRRLHQATASFDVTGVSGWSTEWGDPDGGRLVCHNDLFPENVVFRDGRVVALIDFDMASPGRPFWDVAIAAQEWAPLHAPQARVDHPPHLDAVARTGRLAAAYGVAPDRAEELVDVVLAERAHSLAHIQDKIAAGNPTWTGHWAETGGEALAAADEAWLARLRPALVAAVASSTELSGTPPAR